MKTYTEFKTELDEVTAASALKKVVGFGFSIGKALERMTAKGRKKQDTEAIVKDRNQLVKKISDAELKKWKDMIVKTGNSTAQLNPASRLAIDTYFKEIKALAILLRSAKSLEEYSGLRKKFNRRAEELKLAAGHTITVDKWGENENL